MKAAIGLCARLCMFAALGIAQQQVKPRGEEGRIIALESAWDQAEQNKDANALANLLADNLVYVDYEGSLSNKQQFLASVKGGDVTGEQINNEGVSVRLYNNNVAVSTGIYRDKGIEKGNLRKGNAWNRSTDVIPHQENAIGDLQELRLNGLRSIAAFEDFVSDPYGHARAGRDDVPNELALGSLNGGTAYAFGASPARPLWVGLVRIKNDAVSDSFGNFAHVIFDGNRKRAASALDDEFLGAQDGDFPDGGPVGVRANHRGSHMQGESF